MSSSSSSSPSSLYCNVAIFMWFICDGMLHGVKIVHSIWDVEQAIVCACVQVKQKRKKQTKYALMLLLLLLVLCCDVTTHMPLLEDMHIGTCINTLKFAGATSVEPVNSRYSD